MIELGLEIADLVACFEVEQEAPYVLIRLSAEGTDAWPQSFAAAVRRCYLTDESIGENAARTGRPRAEIVAAALPDPGSTMSGDFGEIVVYVYHAVCEHPTEVIGPKKWRLKQDRTKPAPYSDVIHFVLPEWPNPSERDRLLCSEVKAKATAGTSTPITDAIADSQKDRTSRLAKTLVWLRERALNQDLGTTTLDHLDRFINATDHPQARTHFRAVAVICASLIDDELCEVPEELPAEHSLVVLAVPNLKALYEAVYFAVRAAVGDEGGLP